jgi:hypothetical protein
MRLTGNCVGVDFHPGGLAEIRDNRNRCRAPRQGRCKDETDEWKANHLDIVI